jgi:hypothetical protein
MSFLEIAFYLIDLQIFSSSPYFHYIQYIIPIQAVICTKKIIVIQDIVVLKALFYSIYRFVHYYIPIYTTSYIYSKIHQFFNMFLCT